MNQSAQEPKKVILTDIFFDPPTGMGYPKGTILIRSPHSSQYMVPGTKLGQECIAGYFLIKDICKPVEENSPLEDIAQKFMEHCRSLSLEWNQTNYDNWLDKNPSRVSESPMSVESLTSYLPKTL